MNTSYALTSKYQVTIPKKMREELGLNDKTRISFERRGNELVIKKVSGLEEVSQQLQADLKRRGWNKTATQTDIDNAREEFYQQGLKWQ